jgi:S-DNA-T family DNA segregation ATPase FtsK/SpoIIIE
MDLFRAAVRKHWHRGAHLLMEDWRETSCDFDKFLEILISRRAGLPDFVNISNKYESEKSGSVEKPLDISAQLLKSLTDIGISAEIKGLVHGPRVTCYKVYLEDVNQLDKLRRGLERLSLALNLHGAQPTLSYGDEAKTVCLDIPRPRTSWRLADFPKLREWISKTPVDEECLVVYPGVDVLGNPYSFDLVSAPHLLVGGTTGSGKSVCLHTLILSLLLQTSPTLLKFVLIDTKQVEFSIYRESKYLYGGSAAFDLSTARERILELVQEMETRYNIFATAGVSNIKDAHKSGIALPYIVVFIEELADLVLQDDNIEDQIVRLAQKARAAGIHLVLATQRPDSDTFSGLLRSNIPARIALTVRTAKESKIILEETGAESLLGAGDMLVKTRPGEQADRVHGVQATRSDIEKVLKGQSKLA